MDQNDSVFQSFEEEMEQYIDIEVEDVIQNKSTIKVEFVLRAKRTPTKIPVADATEITLADATEINLIVDAKEERTPVRLNFFTLIVVHVPSVHA